MKPARTQALQDRLESLDADEEDRFLRLDRDGREIPLDAGTILSSAKGEVFVLVHPGDTIEYDAPTKIVDWSLEWQFEIGRAIRAAETAGATLCVIHRSSSAMALDDPAWDGELAGGIARIETTGEILYGDDLDAAADWIAAHTTGATRYRVAGAYGDKDGCVTAVAHRLAEMRPGAEVWQGVSYLPPRMRLHPRTAIERQLREQAKPVRSGRKKDGAMTRTGRDPLEDVRQQICDRVFADYDFGSVSVVDADGWERMTPGTEWRRAIYLEGSAPSEPSEKASFTIRFENESSPKVVEAYGADAKGNTLGRPIGAASVPETPVRMSP